jgi:PilZ domain
MTDMRTDPRVETDLRTLVQVKESDAETWKEIVRVDSVSRQGAAFELSRPCGVGRLVALVLPMPPELRAYDVNEKAYPVMGLVQYCKASGEGDEASYHIGVAFIGKHVPESYKADPQQSYRISGMSAEGLWQITESEKEFVSRKGARYWLNLDVTVSTVRGQDKVRTVTQNISSHGAAVYSSLDIQPGEKVKFGCEALDFHAIAIVRNRKGTNERATLHVEFVDTEIPAEKLHSLRPSSPA